MSRSQRISFSSDETTISLLNHYAHTHQQSLSGAVSDLVKQALEMREDEELSAIADERLLETQEWISSEEFWGE